MHHHSWIGLAFMDALASERAAGLPFTALPAQAAVTVLRWSQAEHLNVHASPRLVRLRMDRCSL